MPFSVIVDALIALEGTQGKGSDLVKKEIVSNVFRTCILNNPEELIQAFYFFLVKLGPDFSGTETGVGEGIVKTCVARCAGTDLKNVRETFQKLGDLGDTAKQLKKGNKGLGGFFKQSAQKKTFLTLQKVFEGF